jgi:hypothetical protein
MVPELVPLPEPKLGLEPEPAHPVLVVTVRPPGGFTGSTSEASPPTKGVVGPPNTGFTGCTWVVPPPTKGPKTENAGNGTLAGCGGNAGAGWGWIGAGTG